MKKYFMFFVAIFSALLVGCNSNEKNNSQKNDQWENDCGAFIQTLTDLAPKAAGKEQTLGEPNQYTKQFVNKSVSWNLTFTGIDKSKNGDDELQFDLEPFGLKHVFFSGKPVMMGGFKPAAGTLEEWKKVKEGSHIKISAVVSDILFAIMSPGDNPDKHVPVAIVTIKDAKIVQD